MSQETLQPIYYMLGAMAIIMLGICGTIALAIERRKRLPDWPQK